MAENSRRDGPLGRHATTVEKDRDVLLEVDGDGDGLANKPCPLAVTTDHRVEHVETHVEARRGDRRGQHNAPLAHRLGENGIAARIEAHGLVEAVRSDA